MTTEATTRTTKPARRGSLGVRISPEDCSGYSRGYYRPHGTSWRSLGSVGYLTGSHLTSGDVDHVVALEEAWCSGIRDPQFGADGRNHRASVSSVNRGKGSRDPREWWNTSGSTTPSHVDYPGWCDYLALHVQVKVSWDGTMDQEEHDFVSRHLSDCKSGKDSQKVTTTTTQPRGGCTHWHSGEPKHTHPGTDHDSTHKSGKCKDYWTKRRREPCYPAGSRSLVPLALGKGSY